MNTNLYDREKYIKIVSVLKTDEDKDSCLRLLTSKDNQTLCQGIYNTTFLNKAIEQSQYVITRHKISERQQVVAFALLEILKSKTLDILLVCTVPNSERFGNMIAFDIMEFGIQKKCKKFYTEPRTAELRKTFIKYGFDRLRGVENVNEVLEKKIALMTIQPVNKTRKRMSVKKSSLSQGEDGEQFTSAF